MVDSLRYTVHQYGTHELQRVGVWDLDVEDKAKYWIIYIHGGAWRDPRITHTTLGPTITRLVSPSSSFSGAARSSIAAFASIDYRLSPHPDFPQDPGSTPADRLRAARHPDHLHDVWAALAWLQLRYGFGARYILAGHSAGGCLAYQVLASAPALPSLSTDEQTQRGEEDVALPAAVFGIEGIYDMTGLNTRVGNAYTGFLSAAFGDDTEAWDEAAPMTCAARYGARFRGLAVLGHSADDELVDMPEADGMAGRLARDGVEFLLRKDLRGKHDEVWRNGTGVAQVILKILEVLKAGTGS
ncbi:alpha/beta-hydrolase [Hypoxylon crocopeplum]|nr:alpha/beta-hydrolase [Hypoxylon crocopeplum]